MSSSREGYFTSLLAKHTSVYIPDYSKSDPLYLYAAGIVLPLASEFKMAGAAGLKVLRECRYKRMHKTIVKAEAVTCLRGSCSRGTWRWANWRATTGRRTE